MGRVGDNMIDLTQVANTVTKNMAKGDWVALKQGEVPAALTDAVREEFNKVMQVDHPSTTARGKAVLAKELEDLIKVFKGKFLDSFREYADAYIGTFDEDSVTKKEESEYVQLGQVHLVLEEGILYLSTIPPGTTVFIHDIGSDKVHELDYHPGNAGLTFEADEGKDEEN